MSAARIRVPRVYASISAITAELADKGLAKSQVNEKDQYRFRGIDDVLNCLAPLLAKNRLCILPRVLERTVLDRRGEKDALLVNVGLRVAFDIVSARDGSNHTIEAFGEALDAGDKATAKAMSAAYKQAMLQTFCIPVEGADDPDVQSHRLRSGPEEADPVQGWDQWSLDIQDMVVTCETQEAIERVQTTYRPLLRSISKRRPELYAAIGNAMANRRLALKPATQLAQGSNKIEKAEIPAHA